MHRFCLQPYWEDMDLYITASHLQVQATLLYSECCHLHRGDINVYIEGDLKYVHCCLLCACDSRLRDRYVDNCR